MKPSQVTHSPRRAARRLAIAVGSIVVALGFWWTARGGGSTKTPAELLVGEWVYVVVVPQPTQAGITGYRVYTPDGRWHSHTDSTGRGITNHNTGRWTVAGDVLHTENDEIPDEKYHCRFVMEFTGTDELVLRPLHLPGGRLEFKRSSSGGLAMLRVRSFFSSLGL